MRTATTRWHGWLVGALSLCLAACAATPVCGRRDGDGALLADRAAALATVQGLFDAMATRNVAKAAAITVADGVFVVTSRVDGVLQQRTATLRAFVDQLGSGTAKLGEHFTQDPTVLVDDDVAVVFGRYAFTIDGALSHTGVDAIALIRTAEGWKIAGGVYSRVGAKPMTGAR